MRENVFHQIFTYCKALNTFTDKKGCLFTFKEDINQALSFISSFVQAQFESISVNFVREIVALLHTKKTQCFIRALLRNLLCAACKLLMVIHILKSDDVLFQVLRNHSSRNCKIIQTFASCAGCVYRFLCTCFAKSFSTRTTSCI